MKYKPQKTNVPIDKKITIEKGGVGMSSSSNILRKFKVGYEKRMKQISGNKENIEAYMCLIEENIDNLLKLHEVLEDLFVEFIDIKEVVIWQKKVLNGDTSIEALHKRSFMLEFGFPNQYIKIK